MLIFLQAGDGYPPSGEAGRTSAFHVIPRERDSRGIECPSTLSPEHQWVAGVSGRRMPLGLRVIRNEEINPSGLEPGKTETGPRNEEGRRNIAPDWIRKSRRLTPSTI